MRASNATAEPTRQLPKHVELRSYGGPQRVCAIQEKKLETQEHVAPMSHAHFPRDCGTDQRMYDARERPKHLDYARAAPPPPNKLVRSANKSWKHKNAWRDDRMRGVMVACDPSAVAQETCSYFARSDAASDCKSGSARERQHCFLTFLLRLNRTVREKKLETKNTVSKLRAKHMRNSTRATVHTPRSQHSSRSLYQVAARGKMRKQMCAAPEALRWCCAVVPRRAGAPNFSKLVKLLLDVQY